MHKQIKKKVLCLQVNQKILNFFLISINLLLLFKLILATKVKI